MPGDYNRASRIEQFVRGEATNVIVAVTGREFKRVRIWIVRIASISNDEISVAAVHHDGVKTQNATVTSAAYGAFLDCATAFGEESIDDLHLRDKALWVDHEIRLSAVVVDRKNARDIRPLRDY
jgi:hypothetical protein